MNYLKQLGLSDDILALAEKAEEDVSGRFKEIDVIASANTAKVLSAFRDNRVSESLFAGTTGYGYDDIGRDTLEKIFADIFGAEAAVVRPNFVNGTHAIACSLFAALRHGDILLSATGLPYDTLQSVIGISGNYPGSLADYGIKYEEASLNEQGKPDLERIKKLAANENVKAVAVQRSRGYSQRPALSVADIREICEAVRSVNKGAAILVDNCYGEFTELTEPVEVGADLMAGSLIKNPGGGLAPTGGYIVGRADIVERAAMRLTVPGIGGECGSYTDGYRLFYQGLFLAPHTVAQAMKTAVFCARLMELMGYATTPASTYPRSDIIQSVDFGKPELLELFCRGIQAGSPVDSYVTPEAWDMPGYADKVIMAAGTFVSGASIELSCDGPMRPPYTAFLQGALTYEAGKLGILKAADMLLQNR